MDKFLWQAVLQTLHFMPVKTAQPDKGLIATDWYYDPQQPKRRVRVAATISGPELRADALKVYVDRQALNGKKQWVQAPLSEKDRVQLEILILERARILKRQFELEQESHTSGRPK